MNGACHAQRASLMTSSRPPGHSRRRPEDSRFAIRAACRKYAPMCAGARDCSVPQAVARNKRPISLCYTSYPRNISIFESDDRTYPFRPQSHRLPAHRRSCAPRLFCWLYSRHHAGQFILRIEDTDLERSTEAAMQQILDGMEWLDLEADEGPFYQTQRFDRYREVIGQLLASGHAYHCYCSKEELDAMRAEQMARKREAPLRRPLPRPHRAGPGRGPGHPLQESRSLARWWWRMWSRAAWCSRTTSSTTSSSCAPTARPPTTSAWWWTTWTCASPM